MITIVTIMKYLQTNRNPTRNNQTFDSGADEEGSSDHGSDDDHGFPPMKKKKSPMGGGMGMGGMMGGGMGM